MNRSSAGLLVLVAAILAAVIALSSCAVARGDAEDYARLCEESQSERRIAQELAGMLATERDALRSDVESLTSECASLTTAYKAVCADNDGLRASARKEAERVRAATVTPSRGTSGSGVERWRSLVAKYFDAAHVDAALRVMQGESRGNPNAVNKSSGCAGLFQQHPEYWAARLRDTEKLYDIDLSDNILDPEANVAVAAMLSNRGASWSHWSVKP